MAICKLTHNQVREWQKTGVRPPCENHSHLSFTKAFSLLMARDAWEVPGQKALVMYESVERYSWTGCSSQGYQVMQMRPIGR